MNVQPPACLTHPAEVRAGLECGIKLGDFNAYEPGDIIECYEVEKVRAAL